MPRVNKWLDLLDRAGWAAIIAMCSAIVATVGAGASWSESLTFIGTAVVLAVAKVVIGQNTGTDDTGALIGTQVIEPPPKT